MAYQWTYDGIANSSVNLAPATGAVAMYYFKEFLKQLGWTVPSSSDGTTYNTTGDQITSGASGAGGFANNSAWIRLYFAATGYEIILQRGTSNTAWRMKWSHSARFTGGTPSATVPPTATDQQHVAGADTPTYITAWTTDNTYKVHMGGDTTDGTFWFFAMPNGGGSGRGIVFLPLMQGSYPSADVAPYTVQMFNAAWTWSNMVTVTVNSAIGQGYYKKGLSGEAWVVFRAVNIASAGTIYYSNVISTNPYTGNDNAFPIGLARLNGTDSSPGWKGWISTTHIIGNYNSRADGDVFDDSISGYRYVYFDDVALRWPSTVLPTL